MKLSWLSGLAARSMLQTSRCLTFFIRALYRFLNMKVYLHRNALCMRRWPQATLLSALVSVRIDDVTVPYEPFPHPLDISTWARGSGFKLPKPLVEEIKSAADRYYAPLYNRPLIHHSHGPWGGGGGPSIQELRAERKSEHPHARTKLYATYDKTEWPPDWNAALWGDRKDVRHLLDERSKARVTAIGSPTKPGTILSHALSFRRLFRRTNSVDVTAFGPDVGCRGHNILVQIFLHKPGDFTAASQASKESDPELEATRRFHSDD